MPVNNGSMSGTDVLNKVDRGMDRLTGNPTHREGPIARAIEEQTAKLPSDMFLYFAGASIVTSLTFKLLGKNGIANFIGQWAPTVLILGLYNKLVKLEGHD